MDPWKVRKTLKLNQKTFVQMWDICSLECVDDSFSVTAPAAQLNFKLGEQCYFFSQGKNHVQKLQCHLHRLRNDCQEYHFEQIIVG